MPKPTQENDVANGALSRRGETNRLPIVIKKGKKEARGFLIGQVMRQTKGKANAKVVGEVLDKKLGG